MLRINLLPAYLGEKRKVNAAIVLMVLLLAIVLAGGLGYNIGVQKPQVATQEQAATDEEAKASAEQAYEQKTGELRSKIKPLQDKVDLVKQVQFNNILRPRIYRQAAKYTYKDVELNSMAISGNTLQMGAIAKSLSDIGRFYILMFGNPDLTAVSITGVPGYAQWQVQEGAAKQVNTGFLPLPPAYPLALTATLVKTVGSPSLPASLQSSAGGGAPAAAAPAAPAAAPTDGGPGGP